MTILNRRVPLLLTMAGAAIMAALLVIPWAAHAQNDATAPRNLTASIVDDGIALDWDTPTENADTVTGYQMLRRDPNEDAVGVFTIIENNTGDDATSYTDTEATTAGQSYTYRVKAWRDEALSNWSNYVRVNLPEEQGATPTPTPTATATPSPTPTATPTPAPTPTPTPAPTETPTPAPTATPTPTPTNEPDNTDGPIAGFTLFDASDQSTVATLTDGLTVELDEPATGAYAIRADVDSGSAIGSVRLQLTGTSSQSRTENVAPYSLHGDAGANALTGKPLPAGSYNLLATAYSERTAAGNRLGSLSVSFTVARQVTIPITDSNPTVTPEPTATPQPTPAATPQAENGSTPSAQQNSEQTVQIAAAQDTVYEGDDIALTVTMSRDYTHDVSFSLALHYSEGTIDETGFNVKTLHGFSSAYQTLQFAAGTTIQVVTIPTTGDEITGEDDRMIANLVTSASSPPGRAVPRMIHVTVKEDDKPPGVPRNFRATTNLFNKIVYAWDPPSESEGGPATSYQITGTDYYLNSDDYWWWDIGNVTSYTYHTVESGTSFGHAVRAVNQYGASFFTKTTGSADGLPWAPDLIINEGDGKLTVHLDPWGCDVDWRLIDEYRVQWKSSDQDYDTSRQIIVATDSDSGGSGVAPVVITGLENGAEYTVRAEARNEHGGSGWTQQGGLIPGTDRPQTPLPEEPEVISE